MLFADLAATSAAVAATSGRKAKIGLLAGALRALAASRDPIEVAAGSAYLAGELRQRQIGLGWAGIRNAPPSAATPSLTVREVDSAMEEIRAASGQGSQGLRQSVAHRLFAAATDVEQSMLRGLIVGELRQGALVGLLAEAIAQASGAASSEVRRALLFAGDFKQVAVAAFEGRLAEFKLHIGRPLAPMLAQAAPDVATALEATGVPAAVDAKLDGIRIQVHRDGDDVGVFSRSLDDLTARVPELVELVRKLPIRQAVLDGEALALGADGRPLPFQDTSSRAAKQESGQLTPFFFDALHLEGVDLVDEPGTVRWSALDSHLPAEFRVARVIADEPGAAQTAFREAIEAGQEGVVIKSSTAAYDVGRRGGAWVKVKPRHTLDLVILAAEWGHGRRKGWLSNLHLGARGPGGDFIMLGKTFKGLTDEMLAWQTARLLELAVSRDEWVVRVRPELVVEIAFDGVQRSTRYPGGVTLRFARVLRYREDKRASEADTLDAVIALGS